MNVVTIQDKKKCIELSRQGLTAREVYTQYYSKLYDTSFDTFRALLKKWKKKSFADDKLLEVGNLSYAFKPNATTVQVNGQGEIVQSWIKSKADDNLYIELIDAIKNLQPFEPVERIEKQSVDRMLEIPFDDMHWGIATFKDYESTLNDTLEIMESHFYKEINIIIGEDLMHTDDLKGHTSNGTYIGEVDIPKAYNGCLRFYFPIVETALRQAEQVRITYSMGNHSETISWTIVQVLKVKFPQAEYDDRLEPRKILTFGQVFLGITHGDTIPKDLRRVKELFIEEYTMEYAQSKVKEIHVGHLHQEITTGDINGCVVRRLSTKVPMDKWHKQNGYTMAMKRFMLFEYSSDRLLSIHYV